MYPTQKSLSIEYPRLTILTLAVRMSPIRGDADPPADPLMTH
jgi:hypothetical protein